MSKFNKFSPVLALALALSPFAAGAASQHPWQKAGLSVSTSISLAANSKGRPSEFTPAPSGQVAVNSKGRPGEFTPATQVADNSRGRPGEFSAPAYETPLG